MADSSYSNQRTAKASTLAIALVCGVAAVPVLAADGPAASAPAAAPAAERQICRRVEETGSRLKAKRICMTQAQWDEQRRQDRQLIERSQSQTRVDVPEGG